MSVLRIALLTSLLQAAGGQAPAGTASVEGVVLKLGTNEPIAGVDLELSRVEDPAITALLQAPAAGATPAPPPPPPTPFAAKSGNDGKFVLRNLPAGAYKLVAARIGGGFVPVEYGQRGVLGRGVPFSLGEGQQLKDVKLEMAAAGTITGRVFDSYGKPFGHAAVMALTPLYREGQQVVTVAQIVHSDDRGEYRLFSLVPGRYYVAARPEDPTRRSAVLNVVPPGRLSMYEQAVSPVVTKRILPSGEVLEEAYGFVYYGGATEMHRSTPLELSPGGNLGAIDIPIDAGKTRVRHVKGKVINGATGGPAGGAAVRFVPRNYNSHLIVSVGVTDAAGQFNVAVVPGSYNLYSLGAQIQQRAPTPGVAPPPNIPLMTMMPIDVANEDIDGLTLSINPGSTINGRVTIDGSQNPAADLPKIRVNLEADPNNVASTGTFGEQVTASGTVAIPNVWPANFRVRVVGAPQNMYVRSIRLGQQDLTADPVRIPLQTEGTLDIVMGMDGGSLDGRVLNDRQEPAVNVKVALIPDAPLRRRLDLFKSTTTDRSGVFRIANVPPGDYRVFAWEDAEDGAWMNPEFLRPDESRGRPVRVSARGRETVDVPVIVGKR